MVGYLLPLHIKSVLGREKLGESWETWGYGLISPMADRCAW